jgi:hypothetical protein
VPLTEHETCLLIIVDAQPGFYPPDMSDEDRAAAETALTRAAWLTALAGALAVPVVVTEEEPDRNGRTDWRFPLPPETPVLVKPTFGLAHERELRVGLDALGDHGRVRARGVGDHGLEHAERGRIVLGVEDHRAVDLDEVDRRAAQQLEAGVAGADVVERDLEAELAQQRDLAHDVPESRRRVLGQLEHELVRLQAGGVHGLDQRRARQRVALERLR